MKKTVMMLYQTRKKISSLEKIEGKLSKMLNYWFEKGRGSIKAGSLIAVQDMAGRSYLDEKKARKYLSERLIKKITSTTNYPKIIIRRVK